MILKIVEIPHALNSTHIGYNAQLSFINGVETIEEIPKFEIVIIRVLTDYDYNYMLQHFKYGKEIVQTTTT